MNINLNLYVELLEREVFSLRDRLASVPKSTNTMRDLTDKTMRRPSGLSDMLNVSADEVSEADADSMFQPQRGS